MEPVLGLVPGVHLHISSTRFMESVLGLEPGVHPHKQHQVHGASARS